MTSVKNEIYYFLSVLRVLKIYPQIEPFFNENPQICLISQQAPGINFNFYRPASSFDPRDPKKAAEVLDFADKKRKWLSAKCSEMKSFSPKFHIQQKRIFEVLCHGPKYSREQQK